MEPRLQAADLGFFSALAMAGSLSAAARELRITTAAVSKRLSHPDDMDNMVRGVKAARALLAQAAFDPYRGAEIQPGPQVQSDNEIRDFIRRKAETIYHPVGTCKMGHDAMAVVDDTLAVHGLQGLRVADASIMPTLIGGNTNAPTVAIAEKAADMILAACADSSAGPADTLEKQMVH
eukprot:gene47185-biopygen40207